MANQQPETVLATGPTPSARVPLSPQLKRLFGFIVPVNLAIYIVVGAIPGVLLPLQVQAIDEADKAANLALITGVGAAAAMITGPVVGLLSDRTRTRFGRRTPWLLGGALTTGLALLGMGFANGIIQLVVAWTITQIALNSVISPLTALLPDRVPSAVRGLFSTCSGIGMMVGILGGQVAGAKLSEHLQAAYLILPGIMLVVIVLFTIVCPDTSSRERVNEPFSLVVFMKTFWVNPVRHPDFFWGFASRITLFIGYYVVSGYQLYLLQDYIGLGEDAVDAIPLLGAVNLIVMIVAIGVSGPLSDRMGRRKPVVACAALIMAASMTVPLLMPTLTGMLVHTAICSIGFGTYMAVDAALMSEVLPSEGTFAKDLGVLNIAATLPQTVGPFVAGAIVIALGYSALFPVAIVLAIVGAVCVLPIKSVR
ncbi:MFS transporter [Nocardia sp. NPDC058499]|uniref:MFS transporter n=1 Tax=Nocardia sp. NPDC058499 TaxID=3346530 RepID=UPI003646B38E